MPLIYRHDAYRCLATFNQTLTFDLRIYEYMARRVIVASDRPLEEGISLVNAIEDAAMSLRSEGINWSHFIEHIPDRNPAGRAGLDPLFNEEFTLVEFRRIETSSGTRLDNPQWTFKSRAYLTQLIGQPFSLDEEATQNEHPILP